MGNVKRMNYHVKDLHEAAFIAFQMDATPRVVRRESRGPFVFEWDDAEEAGVQSRMYLSGAGISREMTARDFAQKFREIKELLYRAIDESKRGMPLSVGVKDDVRKQVESSCRDNHKREEEFIAEAIAEKLERENDSAHRH